MGYDVHITRKDEWFDEDGEKITLAEWKQYVKTDSEMRLDNYAEAKIPNGILRVESEGLSVWLGYSGHEKDGNMAWFDYFEGNIKVKNPDEEVLRKIFTIAETLKAKVQGDDGEIYDAEGNSNWKELRQQNVLSTNVKKWWQFWKHDRMD
jgi:hypothetical protein